MSIMLVVMAHPHTDEIGNSVKVAQTFIEKYREVHPEDKVIIRDLFLEEVPPLNDMTFSAWKNLKIMQDMSKLTPEDQELLSRHTNYLEEFISADKYVFLNPMYNHFLPAELKQYIDVTAVARKTFRYTPNGPVGLLSGKKALHIQAAGGYYHDGGKHGQLQQDFGADYLAMMLNLYGITDINQIFIEGAARFPDKAEEILNEANNKATDLAKSF